MKKLNPRAFKLIMGGLIGGFIVTIIGMIVTDYSAIFTNAGVSEADLPANFVTTVLVVAAVIVACIYAYFIMRLLKNLKAPAPQGYITFLFVIFIIGIILNFFSLFSAFEWTLPLSMIGQILIIAGTSIQRKEPVHYSDN